MYYTRYGPLGAQVHEDTDCEFAELWPKAFHPHAKFWVAVREAGVPRALAPATSNTKCNSCENKIWFIFHFFSSHQSAIDSVRLEHEEEESASSSSLRCTRFCFSSKLHSGDLAQDSLCISD